MKTLKILTAVSIIALLGALTFGMLNLDTVNINYASNPDSIDKQEQKLEPAITADGLKGYDIGDIATDFKLINIDDTYVSLSDFPDALGYVVIFTCNHCPYSKAYEDRIIALDKKYKKLGYPVIAINPNNPQEYPDDSFINMKKRAADKGFTFPYLMDSKQDIYPQYGATKTPHVFLLNKEEGNSVVRYIGAIDDNHQDENKVKNHFLANAIDALLENEEISPTKTIAIGCSIKK
ncbi:thioredoxin family protein [Nonlabens ponticola]|uniref:Thioredoxin family protein n=1 Tax=Nonlabens ponticola TaxID=2496866 RepID=A0A3S9N0S4_9FLAO|nr:thioredoxin family protein [Nonlabens ponticola]AZQ44932.1 thioredoxin family protein [Nonlabens ponticola]